MARQQFLELAPAERERGGPGRQQLERRVVAAGRAQRLAVAGQALQHARIELARGIGDAATAAREQVLDDGAARVLLREAHAVDAGRFRGLHQVHAGRVAGLEQSRGARAAVEAGQQEARGPLREVAAQQRLLLRGVVVGHADQRLEAVRRQRVLHRLEQLHEQLVGQRRNQHRHVRAARRGQRARRHVGHVAEFVDRGLHPRLQLGRHVARAAQRARDGDRAHARDARHVVEGHAAGRTGARALGDIGHGEI